MLFKKCKSVLFITSLFFASNFVLAQDNYYLKIDYTEPNMVAVLTEGDIVANVIAEMPYDVTCKVKIEIGNYQKSYDSPPSYGITTPDHMRCGMRLHKSEALPHVLKHGSGKATISYTSTSFRGSVNVSRTFTFSADTIDRTRLRAISAEAEPQYNLEYNLDYWLADNMQFKLSNSNLYSCRTLVEDSESGRVLRSYPWDSDSYSGVYEEFIYTPYVTHNRQWKRTNIIILCSHKRGLVGDSNPVQIAKIVLEQH